MPKVEQYEALVKVTVELRAEGRQVASYSVTRSAQDRSHTVTGKETSETVVEAALADASAGHRAMLAGVANAERRRLK